MADAARREVLITRPLADAAAMAERVRALAWAPVVAPMLRVVARRVRAPEGVDAVLVTSGNAIGSLGAMVGLPLLAVGDATAARARAAGFGRVESAGGDARALLALAQARLPRGASLLLPTAEGEGSALAAALREAGFTVQLATAYSVHPVREFPAAAAAALSGGRVRAAVFLSARTACTFARLLPGALWPHLAGVDALAIGAPAAAELTPLPWRGVHVPLLPTSDQVLALL